MEKNHLEKYKLIKIYPNSPKLGTEIIKSKITSITEKNTKEKVTYMIKGESKFRLKDPENYKEFWEKIDEKEPIDYEITIVLQPIVKSKYNLNKNMQFGCCYSGDVYTCNLAQIRGIDMKQNILKNNWEIYQVKRLSDGEIFTIGDRLHGYDLGRSVELTMFKIDKNKCLVGHRDLGLINIKNCKKAKQPLFKSEDGVDIFEGDLVVCFDIDSFCLRNRTYRFKEEDINDKNYLFFSTEAKAEEYILMNKPILNVKEICPIIGQCNNTTYIDLDQLTEKLKELVKSRL